jgi:predicted N-acetyltransferase YhbS
LEIKFRKCQEISNRKDILGLLDGAFQNSVFSHNTNSAFFSGYNSPYSNFVTIENDNELLAVAIVAKRKIRFFENFTLAMTIGPFAVRISAQGKGLGKMLMQGIESLAKELSVDLLYLVGIKGFYKSLGFETFMQRSKIVICKKELPHDAHSILKPFECQYKEEMIKCYETLAAQSNFSSVRSFEDWDWLLTHATQSYYFYHPHVVLNESGKFVGYFTNDPENPGRLREASCSFKSQDIHCFLSGLLKYTSSLQIDNLEIMTFPNSPLHKYLKQSFNFSFTELNNADGGQMIKGMNAVITEKLHTNTFNRPSFIFQGDNF